MKRKNFLKKLAAVTLGFVMTLGVGAAGYSVAASETHATETTYSFTNKSWADSTNSWTSGKDGNGFTSNQGVQITSGVTGANATTKNEISNISEIVVEYCTNASKGKGTIKVQVGSNAEKTFSVSAPSSGGTTRKTTTFSYSPAQSGKVKLTVDCGTNSIYIWSCKVTYSAGPTKLDTPTGLSGSQVSGTTNANLTWNAVANASSYKVVVDGSDTYTGISTNSTTVQNLSAGSHSFTVQAIGDGTDYSNSDVSSSSSSFTITEPRELLSISVSGTPTKTTYYVGDDFDPAGLVVTGTYDIGDPEPITEGIEFVSEPETFTSTSQTSVEVLASYGDFTSEPYTVNNLTVQEKPKEFIASFFTDLSTSSSAIDSDAKIKSDYNYTIDENITFSNLVKCYPQENKSFKFGSGSAIGSFTASVPSTIGGKNIHITSVKINMRAHGTDESIISVAGVDQTLTDSYADYTVDLSKQNVTSFDVTATFASNCRYHISKITITYDYPKTLSSISVSENHRSFDLNTTFVPETVTATYSDGSSSEVTPTSITSPDMSSIGSKTISVSYTDSYGSASTSYTINVHYATVTSVTVSPDTYSLGVSGTLDLTTIDVTILPENADQSTFGWTIDPDSKNPSTMDCSLSGTTFSAGTVPGTVDLICTAGDESDKLTVTISAGALISLDKTEVEGIANISSDVEVNATLYNYQSVTSITWTSNDEDVASVSGTSAKGTIKFLHEGSATITCTAVVVNLLGVSETVSETVSVTVTKQLSSISASLIDSTKSYPENTNVPASDLSVTATYSDGQNAAASGFTVTEPLVSMSDNSIKVSYTEGGITAHANVTVTVVKATLSSLSFTGRQTTFKQGDSSIGTFAIGSGSKIVAKYATSFSDETLVNNGQVQSDLKGTLTFKLLSKDANDNYEEIKTLKVGDEMLRSYNGLYTRAYYTYGDSTVYSQAAQITVEAPDTQVAVSEQSEAGYTLVTNVAQLSAGDKIVIVSHDSSNGLQAYASGNNCKGTSVTKSSDNLTLSSKGDAATLTLSDAGGGKFYLYDGAKYLYAASSSGNQLKGKDTTDSTNGAWKFTYANGYMTIVAEGSSNRNQMYYNPNNGSPIFACYGSKTDSYEYLDAYKYSSGGSHDVYYTISEDLYDAIAALPSPLSSSNWSYLESLSSFVASGKEGTNDYKALKLGKAKTDGNMAEQFLAAYDSICGPQELTNYLGRTTLTPHRTIAYGNVDGATLTGGTIGGSYEKGSTINLPTASKTGYNNATWWTLDGTSTGNWGSQVTASFSLENNTTLYAKWTPIAYKITYDLDGGTNHADNPSTYTIEDKITLKAPTKPGCEFSAWSNGGVIEKGSTGDKTFTASWNPLPQTITFTGSHVTSSGASTCIYGAEYNATFTAEENYNLPGSITVKLNGEDYSNYSYSSIDGSFSIASMPAGTISISVTAQEGSTYTISYAEVDGTPITEAGLVYEYEFGTGATLVDAQDRLGFNFAGWYNEPELQNKVESIGATEKGHRKFYAKWEFGAQDALNNVKSSIGMSFTYQKDANAPIVSQSESSTTKVGLKSVPQGYHLEKATSLAAGDKVVLVSEDVKKEMTAISTTSTVYGVGSDYTEVTSLACSYVLTVEAGSDSGTFAFKNGSNYLRWNSGNSLDNAGTSVAKNTSWTVTFSNGNALLVNANDSAREIWWNNSSPRFACYTGKSADNTYKATQLYKLVEDKKQVSSIEIVGTPTKTTYNVGEAYSAAGLSVKATYVGGSQETVTATITPSKQYAEAGDTSVTFSASYEGKTASLPVNVTVNSVYSNVSFKFNFKNTGMDALVSEYGDVYDDMGLVVEYDGRTRYFSFISDDEGNYYIYEDGKPATTFKMKDGGMFTLNLGDMINDENNRASIVFTVKAYIRVGETYYYSSNSESYSVKSWIEYYHSQSKYKDATEDLYNIFFPNGK